MIASRSTRTPRHPARWLATILAVTIAVDQVTKALAWRRWPGTTSINPGGDALVPSWVDRSYADPIIGAVLDAADSLLLTLLAVAVMRYARTRGSLVAASLILAGWMSNLADRLGVHLLTAPGSARGAVDWLHGCNLADVVIALGVLTGLTVVARAVLRRWAPRLPGSSARWLTAAAAVVVVLAGLGATVGNGHLLTPTETPSAAPSAPASSGSGASSASTDAAGADSPATEYYLPAVGGGTWEFNSPNEPVWNPHNLGDPNFVSTQGESR